MKTTDPLVAVGALREIARSLSMAWDLDTTLDLIARKTTEVMHVDSCTIYLLDGGTETLRLRASTGLAKRALGRATLQLGEGLTGHAAQQGRPVFAAAAQDDPHFRWVDETDEKVFHSLLAVPLIIDEQPIGALNVQTIDKRHFDGGEIEMVALIADLAAGALFKAQHFEKQRAQLQELQALARVSEAAISPRYLDDLLDVVTELAAQTMNVAVCSLYLLDETGDYLVLRSTKRRDIRYKHRPPQPARAGVIGWVLETGKAAYVADVSAEPRFTNAELAQSEGLLSMLAVPLTVREHHIGVLCCYTTVRRAFGDEQRTLFSTLANNTALAIENARLATKAAIIHEMHHRIKNNLQTVAMLMQLQLPDADKLDARHVLETNIHRIRSIAGVHEVLSEHGLNWVDVRDVLLRVTRGMAQAIGSPQRKVTITVRGESVQLPSRVATSLVLVVNELVQNSMDHAFKGRQAGKIEIWLGRVADAHIEALQNTDASQTLLVLVRDDGRGLPPDFDHNLGLEIAHTLVADDLGGTLTFHRLPQGTEAVIRVKKIVKWVN